jgi:hypothetical protein
VSEADQVKEELYMESVRRLNARPKEVLRSEWLGYHRAAAEAVRHTIGRLIREHEAAVAKLVPNYRGSRLLREFLPDHTYPPRGQEARTCLGLPRGSRRAASERPRAARVALARVPDLVPLEKPRGGGGQ